MFDVSFTEMMVIGVVALIVIGPERLPKVAKTVGHLLGRAQRYVNDVKGDIRREIELDELRKFKSEMDEAAQSVQASLRETEDVMTRQGEQLREVIDQTAREARASATADLHETPSIMPPIPTTGDATTGLTSPGSAARGTTAPDNASAGDPAADMPAVGQPVASLPAADDPLRTAALRAEVKPDTPSSRAHPAREGSDSEGASATPPEAAVPPEPAVSAAAVRRNESPPPPTWSRP